MCTCPGSSGVDNGTEVLTESTSLETLSRDRHITGVIGARYSHLER